MSTMGERIRKSRESKGLYQSQLAELIGVKSAGVISNWEKDLNKPDADKIVRICQALDISASYLLDYHGANKNAPSGLPEEALKIAKDYTKLDERGKGAVKAILTYEGGTASETEPRAQKVIALPKAKRSRSGITEIEVYDQPAAAGLGNYLDEPQHHIEQYPDDVIPPGTDFGVLISGNSMEPRIHDGGTVFVQAAPTIDPGKIGIFVLNGQAYCKKLVVDHDNRKIRLVSLNPEYQDIVIQDGDVMRTLGRVLGQWTRGYPNDDIFGW